MNADLEAGGVVGREAERETLERVYEALRDVVNRRAARVLPIIGPNGSGRTRFAQDAARFLSGVRDQLTVLWVALRDLPGRPEAPFAALARHRFDLAPDVDEDAVAARIADALAFLPDQAQRGRAVRELVALAASVGPEGVALPPERSTRAVATLANLLRFDAARREHLVVFEDVDAADADLGSWLRPVLERLRDVPVLFLVTLRADPAGRRTLEAIAPRAGVVLSPLRLPPWSPERLGKLLAERLEDAAGAPVALSDARADEAIALAGGRPGRLVALVDAAQEMGLVTPGTATSIERHGWARASRRVWTEEVASLSADERGLLACAAVLGEAFPADLLVAVAGGSSLGEGVDGVTAFWDDEALAGEAAAALAEVERRGLLVRVESGSGEESGSSLAFAHSALRTAAAGSLEDAGREAAHAAAARWWHAHAERPADHLRAAVHGSAAGLAALAAAAWECAARDRSEPLGERAVRAERGRALCDDDDGVRAARLDLLAAEARLLRAELPEAEAATVHALGSAWPVRHRPLGARAHALLARVAAASGDLSRAADLAARATVLARSARAPAADARRARAEAAAAAAAVALLRCEEGGVTRALAEAAEARAAATGAEPAARAAIALAAAEAELRSGGTVGAEMALSDADALLREEGDASLAAWSAALRAEAALADGETDRARVHALAGIEAALEAEDRLTLFRLRALQALLATAAGSDADGDIATVEADATGRGAHVAAAALRLARARVAYLRGDPAEARTHAAAAALGAEKLGAGAIAASARWLEAEARLRLDPKGAREAATALTVEATRRLRAAGDVLTLRIGPTGIGTPVMPDLTDLAEEDEEDTATYPIPFPPGEG